MTTNKIFYNKIKFSLQVKKNWCTVDIGYPKGVIG